MTVRDRIVGLERVRASELVPHPENWRKHPDRQRSILRDMLEEVGIADAVIARRLEDGRLQLIDGHLRTEIDPELSLPVLVVDVDEDEARKLLLSIDPLAAMAQTGREALESLVAQVKPSTEGFDALLRKLGAPRQAIAEDEVPEPPKRAHTKPGDLWMLGEHRLICGDATDPDAWARLWAQEPEALAAATLTDPPYGIGLDYGTRVNDTAENAQALAKGFLPLAQERSEVVCITPGVTRCWYYLVIGPPDGDPTGDIRAVEALVFANEDQSGFAMLLRLDADDIERLATDPHIWLIQLGARLQPFSMEVGREGLTG